MIEKLITTIRAWFVKPERPGPSEPTDDTGISKVPATSEEKPGAEQKRGRRPRPQKHKAPLAAVSGTGEKPSVPAVQKWHRGLFKVPELPDKTRFHDLDLPDPVLHAIADTGFQYCTPIQAEVLPATLKGRDAFGRAQTGTGKTAAFLVAVLTRLLNNPLRGKRKPGTPRVLIIAPTRELVLQIADEANLLSAHCPFSIVSVFGGMDYEKQRRKLHGRAVDIIVATPGRLLDFKRRRDLDLSRVEMLIIDEADRMLDMGFIPDVRQIVYSTPHKDKRQTLFFSATLTPDVTRLSASWTRDPITVEIEPEQVAVDTVEQVVYIVTTDEKFALTYNIITRRNLKRVLIFCNRRDETRRLAEMLGRYRINCDVLSGEVPQKKRIRTLDAFKAGKIRVLVATDVAGRGIHIEDMDYVINFTLPRDPEDYVHRIGRTGRAGAAGTSISFADEEDSFYLPAIEEFIGRSLHCIPPEEHWTELPPAPPRRRKPKPPAGGRPPGGDQPGKRRRRRRPGSGNRDNRNRSGRQASRTGSKPRPKRKTAP
ncbi:DEAD/DEAH box helicase [Desulfosarcina ovata]|uniref:DEAD/DEAH box helicase n=1 Tax=Desulfosarcina ovata TaxID=83564 RepID=UPI001E380587|nr:DEAD/DEAH box helicase [Desulfosarcina ovata]